MVKEKDRLIRGSAGPERELRPRDLTQEEERMVHRGNEFVRDWHIKGIVSLSHYRVNSYYPWPKAEMLIVRAVNEHDLEQGYHAKLFASPEELDEVFNGIVTFVSMCILTNELDAEEIRRRVRSMMSRTPGGQR